MLFLRNILLLIGLFHLLPAMEQTASGSHTYLVFKEVRYTLIDVKSSTDKIDCVSQCVPNVECLLTIFNKKQNICHLFGNENINNGKTDIQVYFKKDSVNVNTGLSVNILLAESCEGIKKKNHSAPSGVYDIYVFLNGKSNKMKVFCDFSTEMEEWTVIQRRFDGSVGFDRSWLEYKKGFGHLNGEFWIGNENLYMLTLGGDMKIRFDLWDHNDDYFYAEYDTFSLSGETDQYKLSISGFSGTAGDAMNHHNGMKFSTKDRDNDIFLDGSCSLRYGDRGGWWFSVNNCHMVNLNGKYLFPGSEGGITWFTLHGQYTSLKRVEMKIAYR